METHSGIAAAFKALSDPTRLRILNCLACCPLDLEEDCSMPTVGQVCCQITGDETITSTLSYHLKELRTAGLIRMERKGRCMVCSLERDAVSKLSGYLKNLEGGQS